MPGIIGAVRFRSGPVAAVPLARGIARLQVHPRLQASVVHSADGRAVLGAVHLGHIAGSGIPLRTCDGSLVVLYGELTSPQQGIDVAARVFAGYRRGASLAALEGSFALAIWDAPARRLVLANDRFGLRNLYYAVRGDQLVFAPLVSAVLAVVGEAGGVDLAAVADFLAFEHVLGDATLCRGVRALPPATIARFDDHGFVQERYWVPRYGVGGKPSLASCAVELGRRLEDATRRALEGPVRAGIPVSGGLDSRALLAVARRDGRIPAPTFTYGIPGSDDLRLGTRVAEAAGTAHHALRLEPGFISARAAEMARLTDGMHLALNVHAAVLQECASWCDVLVLGNGGDCALDRLWWWPDEPANADDFLDRMLDRMRIGCPPALAERLFAPELVEELRAGCRRRLAARLGRYEGATATDVADAYNVGERHWRWVLQGVPAQSTHVEFREPFYDYRVVDFALEVPAQFRAGRRVHIDLIQRRAPDLARIPRQGGMPMTTSRVLAALSDRLKRVRKRIDDMWNRCVGADEPRRPRLHGFADYAFELRGPSRRLLDDVVLSPRALDRGWYRPDALRGAVAAHVAGQADYGRTLGAIATVELWLGEHADGASHDA